MSEQSMNGEMAGSPRDRAIAYLEMRQNGRFSGGKEKGVKTPIIPDKVRRAGPLVDMGASAEKMIDRMREQGYEGAAQKLGELRPYMYDAARAVQMGAKLVDFAATIGLWFIPMRGLDIVAKPLLTWGMWRYRPAELAVATGTKINNAVLREVAPGIVNTILGGGDRVQKTPAVEQPVSA